MYNPEVFIITQDEDVLILIEYHSGTAFIHHEVYKWGKKALKKMDEGFYKAVDIVKSKGFDELWSYFEPHQTHLLKFCERYGMSVMSTSSEEILVMKEL